MTTNYKKLRVSELKKLLTELGKNVKDIVGTGKKGNVMKSDIIDVLTTPKTEISEKIINTKGSLLTIPEDVVGTLTQFLPKKEVIELSKQQKGYPKQTLLNYKFDLSKDEVCDLFSEQDYSHLINNSSIDKKDLLRCLVKRKFNDKLVRTAKEYGKAYDYFDDIDLSNLKVGDIIYQPETYRGTYTKIVTLRNNKLILISAADDAGYANVPVEITNLIEDPFTFYKNISTESLTEGITNIELDSLMYEDIYKVYTNKVPDEETIYWNVENEIFY